MKDTITALLTRTKRGRTKRGQVQFVEFDKPEFLESARIGIAGAWHRRCQSRIGIAGASHNSSNIFRYLTHRIFLDIKLFSDG